MRLVLDEDMHRGESIAQNRAIRKLCLPAIDAVCKVYGRGRAAGVFRNGIDAVDLQKSISALSVFSIAGKHTFLRIFKRDLGSPAATLARHDSIVAMIVRFARKRHPARRRSGVVARPQGFLVGRQLTSSYILESDAAGQALQRRAPAPSTQTPCTSSSMLYVTRSAP